MSQLAWNCDAYRCFASRERFCSAEQKVASDKGTLSAAYHAPIEGAEGGPGNACLRCRAETKLLLEMMLKSYGFMTRSCTSGLHLMPYGSLRPAIRIAWPPF